MKKLKYLIVLIFALALTGCADKEDASQTSYVCFVDTETGVPGGNTSIVRGKDNKIEVLELTSIVDYKNSEEVKRDPEFMNQQTQYYMSKAEELGNIEGVEFDYKIHGEQIYVYTKYDFSKKSVKDLQELGVLDAGQNDSLLYIDKYIKTQEEFVKETNERIQAMYKQQEESGFPVADEFKYEVQGSCSIID